MWNRAISQFSADDTAGRSWATDAHPTRRLIWLFVALAIPVTVVAGRLFYLQGMIADAFVEPPETLVTTYEWIPARDGRILSADGSVFAEDVVRYEVHAHYRWLEKPADKRWLRRRAMSQVGQSDRRKPENIREAEASVLQQRRVMWSRLSALTSRDTDGLTALRMKVQQRIERRVKHIEQRQTHRRKNDDESRDADVDPDANIAVRTWRHVVRTLTTPPPRGRRERIVLPEQSDYHLLLDDITEEAAKEIESHPELYPGLQVRMAARRHYPAATVAAHLIGYRKKRIDDSASTDGVIIDGKPIRLPPSHITVGQTGVERTYDEALRGRAGIRKVVRNHRGEILRTEVIRAPQAGHDVILTVERRLQHQVEQLLDQSLSRREAEMKPGEPAPPRGGCVVAVDVRTGAVLASASAPRFDLNVLTGHRTDEWKDLTTDPRMPLFPRASRMALPPGSVFKTVSAVALLESRLIDPDARVACRGFLDRPDRHRCYIYRHFGIGHGDTNLNDALARSCNVYFYTAAQKIGPNPIVEWGRRFGFGEPTGIDLPGERAGNLPSPADRGPVRTVSLRRGPKWYPGDTLGLAIGQSRLTATPLQVARMMAAVANEGNLITPHVLRRIDAARRIDDTNSTRPRFPRTRIPGLSEGTLQRVREGLRNVVENPRGTGYKHVRLGGIAIAGKTGTAEVGGGKPDHAWFAGYAPADNPRVAFVVVLEHAGSGGSAAGPVAKELVRTLRNAGVIHGQKR